MLILAIDTSTRSGSLAVLRKEISLGAVSCREQEPHSSGLFRSLSGLLGELKLDLHQIDLFAVATGPGSFTGLRVGLTAVKAWAEVFRKPIAAISTLEAIAGQSKGSAGLLAAFFAAGRGQIFGGLYAREEGRLARQSDEVVLSPEEFLQYVSAESRGTAVTLVSSTPEALGTAVKNSAFSASSVESVSGVLAPVVGKLGYSRAMRKDLVDAYSLDANYVRRSDAELLWKGPASRASRA
jgi:tRNA threonylcarbamoyladenosine biosynthesis protein TsaB